MKRAKESSSVELGRMLDVIKRDGEQLFRLGKFTCKKKLSNGVVVRVSLTMPRLKKSS